MNKLICTYSHLAPKLALAGSLAAGIAAQNEPARLARAVRLIPAPQLVAGWRLPPSLPFSTVLDAHRHCAFTRNAEDGDEGEPRVADLRGLLRDLAPLAWGSADVSADLVGDTLVLAGSPDQLHIAEQTFAKIAACVGEPVRIQATAFVLPETADLPTSGASYAELRARLTKAEILGEFAGSAAPGHICTLGALSVTNYVFSAEVEIAQSAAIAAPVSRPCYSGVSLQVQPHALAGNADLVLFVQYARGSELTPVRLQSVSLDEHIPQLQIPHAAVDTGTFSGRIKNGGALLLLADGTVAGRRLGLLVGAERPQVPAELERELGMFPVTAFTSPALRHSYGFESSGANAMHSPALIPTESALQPDLAQTEALQALFARALGTSDATTTVDTQRAVVRGSPGTRQAIGKLIEALQEQFLRTVEVDAQLLGDGQTSAAQSLRFPALLGRRHMLVHGEETTAIAGSDCEVAQKSAICAPRAVRLFTGTELQVQPHALASGEVAAQLELHVRSVARGRNYLPGTKLNISFEQSQVGCASFRHHGRMPTDGALEFGDGPRWPELGGTGRTRQRVAVRAR